MPDFNIGIVVSGYLGVKVIGYTTMVSGTVSGGGSKGPNNNFWPKPNHLRLIRSFIQDVYHMSSKYTVIAVSTSKEMLRITWLNCVIIFPYTMLFLQHYSSLLPKTECEF